MTTNTFPQENRMNTIHIENCTLNFGTDINPLPVLLGTLSLTAGATKAANAEVAPRFTVSDDGAMVTDAETGLIWSKENVGSRVDFEDAGKAVADLNLGGYADWRLPTREELESILDLGRYNPAIDPAFSCDSAWYWTRTPLASSSVCVWSVSFGYGSVLYLSRDVSGAFVRAVRGGASPSGQ